MGNEIALWGTLKEIGSTVNTLLSIYKQTRTLSRSKKNNLEIKIQSYLALERTRVVSSVARNNILEIRRTIQLIDSMAMSGIELSMAMKTLEMQHKQLQRILERCTDGF